MRRRSPTLSDPGSPAGTTAADGSSGAGRRNRDASRRADGPADSRGGRQLRRCWGRHVMRWRQMWRQMWRPDQRRQRRMVGGAAGDHTSRSGALCAGASMGCCRWGWWCRVWGPTSMAAALQAPPEAAGRSFGLGSRASPPPPYSRTSASWWRWLGVRPNRPRAAARAWSARPGMVGEGGRVWMVQAGRSLVLAAFAAFAGPLDLLTPCGVAAHSATAHAPAEGPCR